jgi:hypothetical protein
MQMHSCDLAHAVLCSCFHCTVNVGVGAATQHKSLCVQMLTTKKSPNDILKLFNQQPQSTLFAGSPAQVGLVWALQTFSILSYWCCVLRCRQTSWCKRFLHVNTGSVLPVCQQQQHHARTCS